MAALVHRSTAPRRRVLVAGRGRDRLAQRVAFPHLVRGGSVALCGNGFRVG